ncbi:hypothetical protein [Nocardioides sp. zg-DK7169]|nr:hypothetical protein [Nocardioides sp. zg-DK7169]NPC97453.1 hypothetical protein [Nocardioides sp. zg-DK7169]
MRSIGRQWRRGVRRGSWRALPPEEKARRLAELRARHQAQIEVEARRLRR